MFIVSIPTPSSQTGLARYEASEREEALTKEKVGVAVQPVPHSCVEYSFQATATVPQNVSHLGILPIQLRAETEARGRHSAAVQMPV